MPNLKTSDFENRKVSPERFFRPDAITVFAALVLTFCLCSIETAQSSSWVTTNSMTVARRNHTATLLPSGEVLVAGGAQKTGGAPLASAELYIPATGQFATTGSMRTVRYNHSASLINGKVLVAGGLGANGSGDAIGTAELFDPLTGLWTDVGALNVPRDSHTATLLHDGRLLVAGGFGLWGPLQDAELFDPTTGVWHLTGSLAIRRWRHMAALLPDGRVLVAGGANYSTGGPTYLTSAEIYDPITGTWTLTGELNTPRYCGTASLLPNGDVLAIGGFNENGQNTAEVFDPIAGLWTFTGKPTIYRGAHTATLLQTGLVLVAGGSPGGASVELYDPTNGCWYPTTSMIVGRYQHAATLLQDGKVLITGGRYPSGQIITTNAIEIFTSSNGVPATEFPLITVRKLEAGAFQFSFTNNPGVITTVLSTTNPALPMTNWTILNGVAEPSPGQYEFTDLSSSNQPHRFYRVRVH